MFLFQGAAYVIAPSFFILIICRCWASNTFIFPIFCSNQKKEKSVCLQLLRTLLCFVFRSFRKSFFHVFARLLITLWHRTTCCSFWIFVIWRLDVFFYKRRLRGISVLFYFSGILLIVLCRADLS